MKKLLFILFCVLAVSSRAQSELRYENNLELKAYISEFNPRMHVIDTCISGVIQYYCIDATPWFGSDLNLELPNYQLDSLLFSNGDFQVSLDVTSMYNPTYSGTIDKRHFEIIANGDTYTIRGWFSDGAGTYCARWLVRSGKQLRMLLSNDEAECFY